VLINQTPVTFEEDYERKKAKEKGGARKRGRGISRGGDARLLSK